MGRFAACVIGAALLFAAASSQVAAQTPAPVQQVQSIAETRWTGQTQWNDDSFLEATDWTLYFRSDGVLIYSSGAGGATHDDGRWLQRDTLVMFQTNDYSAIYAGLVRGEVMEGAVYDRSGQRGAWTVRRRPSDGACPQNMVALRGTTASVACTCPSNISFATVWGESSSYTDDSDVCTAAVHAGVVTAQAGGKIVVTPRPGLEAYQGTTLNGVSTLPYGSWSGSYTISPAELSPIKRP